MAMATNGAIGREPNVAPGLTARNKKLLVARASLRTERSDATLLGHPSAQDTHLQHEDLHLPYGEVRPASVDASVANGKTRRSSSTVAMCCWRAEVCRPVLCLLGGAEWSGRVACGLDGKATCV